MRLLKKFLPRSLFGRFLTIIIMPILILQIISVSIFYNVHWERVTRRLAISVAGDIAMVIQTVRDYNLSPERVFRDAEKNYNIKVSFIPSGRLEQQKDFHPTHDSVSKILAREIYQHTHSKGIVVARDRAQGKVTVLVQHPHGLFQFVVADKRVFSSTSTVFIAWLIGMSVILYGIAILFMRNQIRPIRALAQAADALGKGQDIRDIPVKGAREVRQAALAFKRMRERIHRFVQQRTDMLSGVSHDVRTPLTRLKLEVSLLKEGKTRTSLLRDIEEMEHLLNSYLAFARGEETEKPVMRNITALIENCLAVQIKNLPADKSLTFEEKKKHTLLVRPNTFKRALINVLENAMRYAHHATILIAKDDEHLMVIVDDNGPGIARHKRQDVFRPFYRLDESRNRNTGGMGLGLSIARDAMRANGGDIELGDSPDKGLRVILMLPK